MLIAINKTISARMFFRTINNDRPRDLMSWLMSSFSLFFLKETSKKIKQTAECDILCLYTQDFCKSNDWPPIKELKITKSKDGQSCEFACLDEGLVCELTFFTAINTQDTLTR